MEKRTVFYLPRTCTLYFEIVISILEKEIKDVSIKLPLCSTSSLESSQSLLEPLIIAYAFLSKSTPILYHVQK